MFHLGSYFITIGDRLVLTILLFVVLMSSGKGLSHWRKEAEKLMKSSSKFEIFDLHYYNRI